MWRMLAGGFCTNAHWGTVMYHLLLSIYRKGVQVEFVEAAVSVLLLSAGMRASVDISPIYQTCF